MMRWPGQSTIIAISIKASIDGIDILSNTYDFELKTLHR